MNGDNLPDYHSIEEVVDRELAIYNAVDLKGTSYIEFVSEKDMIFFLT